MPETGGNPTCFIAMPITTQLADIERYGGDQNHWSHVMGTLFEKAVEQAGFEPIRPNAVGANLIHGEIIRNLSMADLVLVDLSTHNPNVFFELGVRTSINRPIALVRDEHTSLPFDISGINTYEYDSKMLAWEVEREKDALAQHIKDSHESCAGQNPLWKQFGLTITASEPNAGESPLEAKVDLLLNQFVRMQSHIERDRFTVPEEAVRAEFRMDESRFVEAAEFFAVDVAQYLKSAHPAKLPKYEFEVRAPGVVMLFVDSAVSSKDQRRIRELAKRHGIDVDILRPDLDGLSPESAVRLQSHGVRLSDAERPGLDHRRG